MPNADVKRGEIRDVVRDYLLDQFLPGEDPSALTDSTALISGGILDSIASVKLVSYLEDRFAVRFEAHEISVDHLDTVALIVDTVERKLQ